jgi:hypothetical protein
LNNASVLTYAALMNDQGKDPVDILLSGWDADTLNAYRNYCATLQASYSASPALAWSAYPEFIFHASLDHAKFPRVNSIINWLNLGTQYGLVEVAEQHFTQNLGGYAKSNGFSSQASGEHTNLWIGTEANMEYKSVERVVLKGIWMAVSPRRLVSQMFEGTNIGYRPITSDTEEPIEPTHDLGDNYNLALQNSLLAAIWHVIEGERETLTDQGFSKGEARAGALQYAKNVFLGYADTIDASPSTIQMIKDIATNDLFNAML